MKNRIPPPLLMVGTAAGLIIILITEWQIKPEEAALKKLFGSDFEESCRRVRRWI